MPEIAEVARITHYIRKHLVGKTISTCKAAEDANVYGKNKEGATTAADFQKHMTGNKIIDAGQQGKYFWMIMAKPPHPLMHFGMSGWIEFKSEHTFYYRPAEGQKEEEWPPQYWKFHLETKAEKGQEPEYAAFKDKRRFARIRLMDVPGKEIRDHLPLSANGPDPVVDKDKVTLQWLTEKCHSKKVPIKAMLLDQANISGIGNWVGDEIMYNAKMHPEQYANTLSDDQIKKLHKSIHYICDTACELLADSEKFPEDWLFKHRWGKGKKDASKTLPNGEKIVFMTVGGRTSAVIPSVQKKTGPVAGDVADGSGEEGEAEKPKKAAGKKRKVKEEEEEEEEEEDDDAEEKAKPTKKAAGKKGKKEPAEEAPETKITAKKAKQEEQNEKPATKAAAKKVKKEADQEKPAVNGTSPKVNGTTAKKGRGAVPIKAEEKPAEGRRRSGRQSKG